MPSVSPLDIQVRLYETALAIYKEHYKDLMDRWRSIETKAQSSIATTGILIAGLLAFIRDLEAGSSDAERVLLTLLLFASIATMLLGVVALRVRSVSEPPFVVSVEPLIMDFVDDSGLRPEHWRDIVREQLKVWKQTNADLRRASEEKARMVAFAQAALAGAAIIAVIFCFWRIFDLSSVPGTLP